MDCETCLKLVQVAGRLFSENKTENTGLSGGRANEDIRRPDKLKSREKHLVHSFSQKPWNASSSVRKKECHFTIISSIGQQRMILLLKESINQNTFSLNATYLYQILEVGMSTLLVIGTKLFTLNASQLIKLESCQQWFLNNIFYAPVLTLNSLLLKLSGLIST